MTGLKNENFSFVNCDRILLVGTYLSFYDERFPSVFVLRNRIIILSYPRRWALWTWAGQLKTIKPISASLLDRPVASEVRLRITWGRELTIRGQPPWTLNSTMATRHHRNPQKTGKSKKAMTSLSTKQVLQLLPGLHTVAICSGSLQKFAILSFKAILLKTFF